MKGFDHPCKETCSGWKQGYEKGKEDKEVQVASCCVAHEEALASLYVDLCALTHPSFWLDFGSDGVLKRLEEMLAETEKVLSRKDIDGRATNSED